MTVDLTIRDVLAVLPDRVAHADIEVADGRIASIVETGAGSRGKHVLEGGGREAFPGVIDPHMHFRAFQNVGVEGDQFEDVAEAAARSGVTSFVAFVIAPPDVMGMDAVGPVIAMSGRVPVDYGLHYVLYPNRDQLDRLPELYEAGVRSFKMFFAYPERGFMFDGPIAIEAFERIARLGGLALVHAEEGNTIRWVEDRARNALGSAATIVDYLGSRPKRLEAAGVEMVALWAALVDCPIYVVHLSTGAAVPTVRALLESGADVVVETCPHYLTLDHETLAPLGPLAKFGPVARTKEDNEALWQALREGLISTIGSDHAGHTARVKLDLAAEHGIFGSPFGMPGIETLFPVLYTHGVVGGRLTREQLAAVTSTNTAQRFGWFPRKGGLQVGSDADLFLVDPSVERPVRASELRSRAGYSPYEGMELRGWPSLTVRRGEVVFDGTGVAAEGGIFVPTDPSRFKGRGRRE